MTTTIDESRDAKALREAFVEDHRVLTRGFQAIIDALNRNDVATAAAAADEIDRAAGAHIAFEEEVLYPLVARIRGEAYAERLLREHRLGQSALEMLAESHGKIDPRRRRLITTLAHAALDHAVSCGTLISHLTTLGPKAQGDALARLLELRARGQRWRYLDED